MRRLGRFSNPPTKGVPCLSNSSFCHPPAIWPLPCPKRSPRWRSSSAQSRAEALAALPTAQACFGTLDPELLAAAAQLKWLAAPAAGPPKGYYFPELIASDVAVTNFRGIFNDHISAHIMAFVLALSRGMHHYFRNQFAGQWQSGGESSPRPTCPKPPR